MIDSLRGLNIRLKNRLKTLNGVVERAIDKTDTKRIMLSNKKAKDPTHVSRVKDRELENALQQKEFYEEEIARLTNRIDELTGVDKLLSMEDRL